MNRRITPATLMSILMSTVRGTTGRSNPPRTPDVPRDDEGHKAAAESKRRRKAAKREALAAVKQPNDKDQ